MSTQLIEKNDIENVPRVIDRSEGRIDLGQALELRFKKNSTLQEIGDHFGVTRQAVSRKLRAFMHLLSSEDGISAYREARRNLLTAAELKLMEAVVDKAKIKDASLNNAAYALKEVHNMRRLEEDKSTANVAQKLVFQVVGHDQEPDVQP